MPNQFGELTDDEIFGAATGGDDELAFRQWYGGWAQKAGLDPNPDAPEHRYDYRAAFRAGAVPQIDPGDGLYHWPSQFKADDHPNRFVNGVDTKYGGAQPKPGELSDDDVFGTAAPAAPAGRDPTFMESFTRWPRAVVSGLDRAGRAIGDVLFSGAGEILRPVARAVGDEAGLDTAISDFGQIFDQKRAPIVPVGPTFDSGPNVADSLVEGLSQGAAGFAGGMGAVRQIPQLARSPWAPSVAGGIGDLFAFSGSEPNVSTLIEKETGVPMATAIRPGDSELAGRLKNVGEGAMLMGPLADFVLKAAGAGIRALIRRRTGRPEAEISDDEVRAAAQSGDPEIQAILREAGATDEQIRSMSPEAQQRFAERVQERRARDDERLAGEPPEPIQRAAEREAIAAGDMDPAAASTVGRERFSTPERIIVDSQGRADTGDLGTRAGADAADRVAAETRRQAEEAFRLAELQRTRAGASIRDTQPAARPEGVAPQTVYLDDDFPVQILERRMVPDASGRMIEVARVQRYDPRTGQAVADAPEYEVPVRQLRTSQYAVEPRRAQDFAERAQSPRNPEEPRMAHEGVRQEPDQTYRMTQQDPNTDFPGAGPGRSPMPEQPDGPFPGRDRPQREEDYIRAFEEARAREEARRAAGDRVDNDGPRQTDNQASNTPRGQDGDGRWLTDDRGFVMSDKGGPVRFGDQRQAAKWIINVGHKKSPDQIFELANHPSGKGYAVRERGRAGGGPEPGPAGRSPQQPQQNAQPAGEPRQLPPPRQAEAPRGEQSEAGVDTEPQPLSREERQQHTEQQRQRDFEEAQKREPGLTRDEFDQRVSAGREHFDQMLRSEDRQRGTKLYSGLPLDEIGRMIGDVVAEWKKSIRDFIDEHVTWYEAKRLAKVPGASLFRAVLGDADSEIRGVVKKIQNPKARQAAEDFIDQFFVNAGTAKGKGETYDTAVSTREVARINQIGKALEGFMEDKDALRQIVNLVRNPGNIRDNTKIGRAARQIQKLLREELEYLRAAGVDVGEVRNGYFPRTVDEMQVRRDPEGFLSAAQQAYQRAGLSANDAKAAAISWRDNILYGDNGSIMVPPGGTIEANFIKGRQLTKEADKILEKFLINDPMYALVHYVGQAARRAEFTRRIGPENSKWKALIETLQKNDAAYAIPEIRDYIATVTGTKPSRFGASGLATLSWLRTWGTLGLLEKATLTSIPEAAMASVRSGNAMDFGRSVGATIKQFVSKDAKSTKASRELAEDLGLIVAHGNHMLSAARFAGGDPSSLLQQKVLQTYFRNTGLERFTNATRVAATGVGQVFMRRWARRLEAEPNVAKTMLAELGIPKEKAADFSKWLLSHKDGMPDLAALRSDKNAEMVKLYEAGVKRFVEQTVMRPSAHTRPRWASHPFGAVVFHLMNYTWAFQKNILNRPFRLMADKELSVLEKARIAAPIIGMWPALYGIQAIISEGRDAVFGDPTRTEPRTPLERAMLFASRAGLTGKVDPFINLGTGVRYGRDIATSALGPVLGRLAGGAQTGVEYLTRNSERTNAAERKMAKTAYDLGVEPTLNYLLSALPAGSLVAAGARQAIGSGTVREAFTEAVAGAPEKKGTSANRANVRSGSRSGAR